MPRQLAFAVAWLSCQCFPALGSDSALDEAITKAARISGRWEATLDQAQSEVFSTGVPSHLILNVGSQVRRNGESVETSIVKVRLDIESEEFPRMYSHINLGNAVLTDTEDGIQFSATASWQVPTEIRTWTVSGSGAKKIVVLIIHGTKSAHVVFARPAVNPNEPLQGDWINEGSTGVSIIHVYAIEPFPITATLDQISADGAYLGYTFSDWGSDLKTGSLHLSLDSPSSVHSLIGKLDGPNELTVEWRGSGFLSEPDFHRLAPGSYTLKAPRHF